MPHPRPIGDQHVSSGLQSDMSVSDNYKISSTHLKVIFIINFEYLFPIYFAGIHWGTTGLPHYRRATMQWRPLTVSVFPTFSKRCNMQCFRWIIHCESAQLLLEICSQIKFHNFRQKSRTYCGPIASRKDGIKKKHGLDWCWGRKNTFYQFYVFEKSMLCCAVGCKRRCIKMDGCIKITFW